MRFLQIICITAALAGARVAAQAETALQGIVREDFASQVRVGGGGILVGLALGPVAGKADPRDLRIPLGFPERTRICVTGNTRDGQYWSDVALTAPPNTAGVARIDPQPQWRFLDQLRRYDRASFAAVARFGPKCDIDPAAGYLPVVYDGPRTTLTAAFNSQRAIASSAQLTLPHKPPITGACTEIESDLRATAFDLVCRFDLTGVATDQGAATLTLRRQQRTGERTDQFTLRLP
jgi:hypothetical protein